MNRKATAALHISVWRLCVRNGLATGLILGASTLWTALNVAHPAYGQQIPGLVVTTTPAPSGPPADAAAPTQLPGLIVSTPPGGPQAPPPGFPVVPTARPPQPAPEVKAKLKPKAAAVKQARLPDASEASKTGALGIVALVNDEPVTAYEVERLATFMSLSANFQDRAKANMKAIAENPKTNERLKAILQETIQANQGKTREQVIAAFEERKKQFVMSLQRQAVDGAKSSILPGLRKKATEELIEDRLKFQEAKKLSVTVGDDEVEKAFKGISERNKMTPDQFTQFIKAQGGDAAVMRSRFKSQFTWREVIRRRFGHMITISNKDVDKFVASSKESAGEGVELQLHKITLAAPGKLDQKIMAQRLDEAESVRAKFTSCKDTPQLAKSIANAKFEDLSYRSPVTITEPTRSFLLSARDGDMLPGNFTSAGVELYAVCGRRAVKLDEQKRAEVENNLQLKEFERLAQRHIQDLKKDALIEIK